MLGMDQNRNRRYRHQHERGASAGGKRRNWNAAAIASTVANAAAHGAR